MYEYRAKITNVVDGDTVDAMIDLGFGTWKVARLRLADIDAPEPKKVDGVISDTDPGYAATFFLADLVIDETVTIRTYKKPDSFGRYIAAIFKHDVYINREMVLAGHAEWYRK